MAEAKVEDEIAVGADALWGCIADFGDVSWMPGGMSAKVEGSGPGMVRVLQGPQGEIRERLESVDAPSRTLVYEIPVGIPFPVSRYRATMAVREAGAGRSVLRWSCQCEPDGVPAAEAVQAIETMYRVMIGWIRDHLGAGTG